MPEVVEVIIRASFETKGLPEETVKRAIKRVFRGEIVNSDKWRFYNGRGIYADVEIRIGNAEHQRISGLKLGSLRSSLKFWTAH